MDCSNDNILQVDKLEKTFDEDKNNIVNAVNNVNFTIKKGETMGLVGESGCGKSTLAQILLKLKEPTKGDVIFTLDNEKYNLNGLKGKKLKEFRKKVQIVFQDPYSSLNPKKTMGFLLEEPLIIHKISKTKAERDLLIDEMLSDVGLNSSFKYKYPYELSGGQRQRIAIAIALMSKPEFLVCDEAVSSLDVSVEAQILNLLKDLQEKYKLTYLFISHNLNVVSYMSDKIAVMYLGEIVETGNVNDLSENPMHPYTKALFAASPTMGENKTKQVVLSGEIFYGYKQNNGCSFAPRCPYKTDNCIKNKPKIIKCEDGRLVSCHLYN